MTGPTLSHQEPLLAADRSVVIGFCGLAGSGKTTLAEYLVQHHGFIRLPFAGPLKAMAAAFGLTAAEMSGSLKEEPCEALCGRTPRQFMQWLGTEFGRQMLGPDLWVNAWLRQLARNVEKARAGGGALRLVCDDVRFANEAAAIRALGGKVLLLRRPGSGAASGFGHLSEALNFAMDGAIENDQTVHAAAAQACSQVRSGECR